MTNFVRGLCVFVTIAAITVGLVWQPKEVVDTRSDNLWLACLAVAAIALTTFFWYGWAKLKPNASPNARLRHNVQRVGTLMIVAFVLLSLQLLREQIVQADDIKKPFYTDSGDVVHDPRADPFSVQRGNIRDSTGKIVVGIEVSPDGSVKRTYKDPNIAQIVGYYSPIQYGLSGLEKQYDDYLSGTTGANPILKLQHDLLHEATPGNDLILTIDPALQTAAINALGATNGSIVLLDANTGGVLAMVGNPHYDPSRLAYDPTLSGDARIKATKAIGSYWQQLINDPNRPLVAPATQRVYTPGSIFKTITLGTALDLGLTSLDTTWFDDGQFTIDFHRINDPNRPDTSKKTWTSQEGYMFSLNAVFAQMGLKIGADNFTNYTNKFGFGQNIPFDLPVSASTLYNPSDPNFLKTQTALTDTGFGQGQLQVTPLQMALVAAAMGRNDGAMPKPFLVKEIRSAATVQSPQGLILQQTKPDVWLRPLRQDTTKLMQTAMLASAKDGWVGRNGGGLPATGATIGGKTGTAELGNGIENAWYIAWASKGGRTFAIACVVDHKAGGEGLRDALPKANAVLQAALAGIK